MPQELPAGTEDNGDITAHNDSAKRRQRVLVVEIMVTVADVQREPMGTHFGHPSPSPNLAPSFLV